MVLNKKHLFLSSSADMTELSNPLNQFGICYFTYTRSYDSGERIYLTSHREILENYLEKKWDLLGNVESKPSRYKPQMVFWSTLPKQHIYDDNVRARGIDHGIFIIEPHENYCDFYGFAAKKENHWVHNVYLTHVETLKTFTLYFKDKAAGLLKKAESKKILLPFHNDNVEFLKDASNFEFPKFTSNIERHQLTSRQTACLTLLAQGKKIKEIASIIGLSHRTIEDHVNILKKKFNCRNKSELLIKSIKILDIAKTPY